MDTERPDEAETSDPNEQAYTFAKISWAPRATLHRGTSELFWSTALRTAAGREC
jgi:hypothetical protein